MHAKSTDELDSVIAQHELELMTSLLADFILSPNLGLGVGLSERVSSQTVKSPSVAIITFYYRAHYCSVLFTRDSCLLFKQRSANCY